MRFIDKLLRELPKDTVLIGEENTRPYECDALTIYRQKPLAIVLPRNVEQIKYVLKICKDNKIPIVTRGAGTGLSGGALPLEGCVVLGLSKMDKIHSIDPKRAVAIVDPGVRNLAISEAVESHGLYFAPDPSSQIACTIGGNIAENAGGVHCLKYGLTVNNIQSITMLTLDGQ